MLYFEAVYYYAENHMMWYILYYVLKQGYIVYGDQHPGRWGLYIYTGKKIEP